MCPICSSPTFVDYNNRKNALCRGCGALERGRLAWALLERLQCLSDGTHMLNVAPEPFMLSFGLERLGASYVPADFSPHLFAKWNVPVRKIDLCGPLIEFEPASFDVVMHNHVLEHIPCDVVSAMRRLCGLVRPGGYHLFSTPIMPNRDTEEDLDPDLPAVERRRRFGQDDHVRMFGGRDFLSLLHAAGMRSGLMPVESLIGQDELERWAIPGSALVDLNSHRVFVWRRPLNHVI